MIARIKAVWRHYSTWALGALLAVGSLYEYVPAFREDLPSWVMPVLAFAGLIGKLIPQDGPGEKRYPTYHKYLRDRKR